MEKFPWEFTLTEILKEGVTLNFKDDSTEDSFLCTTTCEYFDKASANGWEGVAQRAYSTPRENIGCANTQCTLTAHYAPGKISKPMTVSGECCKK